MRVLLDTCVALWLAVEPEKLSAKAAEVVGDGNSVCLLSAVSVWELASKYGLGKLLLPDPPPVLVPQLRAEFRLTELPFGESAAVYGGALPFHHKDPFDRMLVSQAIVAGVAILTPDERIREYPIQTIW